VSVERKKRFPSSIEEGTGYEKTTKCFFITSGGEGVGEL
jgi:hypothetical protein